MTGWFETNRGRLNRREPAFEFLFNNLPKSPVIVETGSLRSPGNVDGDGNATMLFDELTAASGLVYSLDIDAACGVNIEKHCGRQVQFVEGDSLDTIRLLATRVKNIDLLYLDSLDVDFAHDELAAKHALTECQYSLSMLSRRAFVAVDDNDDFGRGKGRLVEQFAQLKGWPLVVDGYVKIWSCNNGYR